MITIDFETKGIEGNPIVNPPEPVGVAIKSDDRPSIYYTGAQMKAVVMLAWQSDDDLLFHNAPFDISVARRWFDLPALPWERVHDTRFLIYLADPHANSVSLKPSAERLLGWEPEERDELREWIVDNVRGATKKNFGAFICEAPEELVSRYARVDTDMTYALFRSLYEAVPRSAYDAERELQHYLTEATKNGIRLDTNNLEMALSEGEQNLIIADQRICDLLDCEFDVHNSGQLADALDKAGKITEWKLTPTGRRSTARPNLISCLDDPELLNLLSYSGALRTCITTFMRPWLALTSAQGRLHPSWNQVRGDDDYGTRTGRMSCSQPNLQNVPNEFHFVTPAGLAPVPKMRDFLLPERGEIWFSRDFSAQEMRLLAHFEDGDLMRAFQATPDLDPHAMVQTLILEKTGLEVTRKRCKNIGFGIMYGMGARGLSKQMGCEPHEASVLMQAYHAALPGVANLQKGTKYRGRCRMPIKTVGGREYYAEEPRAEGCTMRTFEYKLLNYLIQGSAADQTKYALLAYFRNQPEDQTFLCTVHDEINISVPPGGVDPELRAAMEGDNGLGLDVPMTTTLETGTTWGNIK